MAEARISVEQFSCPVCLDLLKDPVTIQCGHSYCKSCITDCWDQEDEKRVYSCPQCRQTFSPRPALFKNVVFAEMLEKLKQTKLQSVVPAGAGDVQCDVCTGRQYRAVKSCLVHGFIRSDKFIWTPGFMCSLDDLVPVVFCDVHYHLFVLQKQLKETQKTLQQRIQQREKDLQQLREAVESHKVSLEKKRNSRQLSLDLNTVNKHLRLSESNRVITYTGTVQSYPDHPDRFDYYYQVLCRESVCGRCYWELEWSGGVYISVSYKSISRKGRGKECMFGFNDQSWSLRCSKSRYSFRHNNTKTDLSVKPISSRIGVFVDHSAGTLSFYSVSDTMSLIHTVQTTFTQTLYPGSWVYYGSSVKLLCY
uniref:Uncharacterized protein n=1 Tax=Sinocyclocheilus grahami TaxID=75366 RepID=A0A672LZI6_SINGR